MSIIDSRTPEALEKRRIQEALRHDLNEWCQTNNEEFEKAPMWTDYLLASQAYFDATTEGQRDAVAPLEIEASYQEIISRGGA